MKNQISQCIIFALLAITSQYSFADEQNSDSLNAVQLMSLNPQIKHRLEQQIDTRLQYDMAALNEQSAAALLAASHDKDTGFIRPSQLPAIAAK
jgi:hypothetical protein